MKEGDTLINSVTSKEKEVLGVCGKVVFLPTRDYPGVYQVTKEKLLANYWKVKEKETWKDINIEEFPPLWNKEVWVWNDTMTPSKKIIKGFSVIGERPYFASGLWWNHASVIKP